jgi:hypothetical protein
LSSLGNLYFAAKRVKNLFVGANFALDFCGYFTYLPTKLLFRAMFPETIEIGFNCHLFGWWQTFPKNVLFDER